MISYRHHIVSLVAVFLALAVGVVLGGGPLSELHDEILSGVRAAVYERALPLATRKLAITTSELGSDAGVMGAIALVTQEMFTAEGVARLLASTRT